MNGCPTAAALRRCVTSIFAATLLIAPLAAATAQGQSARITRAIKDVKLAPAQGPARATSAGDSVSDGTLVRTGASARAEIAYSGRAIARLGGKTALRLRRQGSDLELQEGAVLFQVPKSVRGVTIATAGITVATPGTTGLIERYGSAYVKVLVLEGTARVYLKKIGESVLVGPGQMLITRPGAATLPEPVHFDIAQLLKTSLLTSRDFGPLASGGRIEEEIRKQRNDPNFTPTNLVIYGRGTLVTLVPPTPAAAPSPKPRNSPPASTRGADSRSN